MSALHHTTQEILDILDDVFDDEMIDNWEELEEVRELLYRTMQECMSCQR